VQVPKAEIEKRKRAKRRVAKRKRKA